MITMNSASEIAAKVIGNRRYAGLNLTTKENVSEILFIKNCTTRAFVCSENGACDFEHASQKACEDMLLGLVREIPTEILRVELAHRQTVEASCE